jgi:hypothetical protein
MARYRHRFVRPVFRANVALLALAVLACQDDPTFPAAPDPPQPQGFAHAYGLWSPGSGDTCSQAAHDAYSVVGPDGLVYPTWHPPEDPLTGCTFGHEHGRDPAGSDLAALVGPIPFGYANQHLIASGFGAERHEDHVGHKIDWENDMAMRVGDGGSAVLDVRCDVLVKMHQGTHSADAFTNNMHEVAYHIRCTDGTGFSATLLTPIGQAGELVASCERDRHVPAGAPNPLISPDGGGKRAIPDAGCLAQHVLSAERPRFDRALRESWEISASLRAENGRVLASFNPYFQVMDPSRYYAPGSPGGVARPVDLCHTASVQGRDRCEGVAGDVTWNDARSPFKGTRRFTDINGNRVRNADGPQVWYTDPLGRNGQPLPFPGGIRQWIAKRDNGGLDLHGPVIGRDRNYDAPGVHAPN